MKRFIHIVISLLYILWGIGAPLSAIHALLDLDLSALIMAAASFAMLLAGIFGLFKIKPVYRRVFGAIILILAGISVITSLDSGLNWQALVQALMALLYLIWG